MLKKIIKGMIVGGAVLALAGPASAQLRQINIFGASAQYNYWTQGAPQFLANVVGCGESDIGHAQTKKFVPAVGSSRDVGIAMCDGGADDSPVDLGGSRLGGTNSPYNGDTVIIRYTTFASAEGVYAGLGIDPKNAEAGACSNATDRQMADETNTTFTHGTSVIPAPTGGVHGVKCVDIQLGTADIDPACFTQKTYGPYKWDAFGTNDPGTWTQWKDAMGSIFGQPDKHSCRDCDTWWIREFSPIPVDSNNYTVFNPVVVPFAFFVHQASLGSTVTNITRPMAQMLFSQQVENWSSFYPGLNQEVVLCIRHAGSGTHATMDWHVVNPFGMAQLAKHPDEVGDSTKIVQTYTNKGSSDEAGCIAYFPGAIGYLDADKNGPDTCAGGVCRTLYQGVTASRDAIRKGLYDFEAANWVVANNTDAAANEVQDLMAYMADPSNLDLTDQAGFWASQDEMQVTRSTCKSGIILK
jgi:hypothetical protein